MQRITTHTCRNLRGEVSEQETPRRTGRMWMCVTDRNSGGPRHAGVCTHLWVLNPEPQPSSHSESWRKPPLCFWLEEKRNNHLEIEFARSFCSLLPGLLSGDGV